MEQPSPLYDCVFEFLFLFGQPGYNVVDIHMMIDHIWRAFNCSSVGDGSPLLR